MNDADAIIFRRPHITFARASIAGAIIDEDDFQVAIALLDNALDTLIKIPFHVVDGNDHADQRLLGNLIAHACTVTMLSASKRLDIQVSTSGRK